MCWYFSLCTLFFPGGPVTKKNALHVVYSVYMYVEVSELFFYMYFLYKKKHGNNCKKKYTISSFFLGMGAHGYMRGMLEGMDTRHVRYERYTEEM